MSEVIVLLSEKAYRELAEQIRLRGGRVFRSSFRPRPSEKERISVPKEQLEAVSRYLEEIRSVEFPDSAPIDLDAIRRFLLWAGDDFDRALDAVLSLSLLLQKRTGPIKNWSGVILKVIGGRSVADVIAWAEKEQRNANESEPEKNGHRPTESPLWSLDPAERLRRLKQEAQG